MNPQTRGEFIAVAQKIWNEWYMHGNFQQPEVVARAIKLAVEVTLKLTGHEHCHPCSATDAEIAREMTRRLER